MVTSRYIQIADWLLLEYEYSANAPDSINYPSEPIVPGDEYAGVYRIKNDFLNEYQFVNKGVPVNGIHITGNCLDWSVVPVDTKQNKWAVARTSGSGNNVFDEYDELTLQDYDNEVTNVYYDTVKLHILSGYNLEGLDGIALDVIFKENSKKNTKAASLFYSADLTTQTTTPNTNPILLAEKSYDKYIEFKVPALKYVQEEYWADPADDTKFAYHFSHPTNVNNTSPGGFVLDSPIYFELRELVNVTEVDDIDYFDVKNTYTATVTQADTYSSLGCIVKESDNGDYYEYYPTYQGGFVDNYIDRINSVGNNSWTVVNEIRILEQIGTSVIQTAQIVQFQNDSYDVPNYYRPIIKNASTAFAFSINYVMKFFNRTTGEQIIRTSNITSYEPKKYGLGLMKINIEDNIKPINVYNKVVNLKRLANNTPIGRQTAVTTKYVDVFTDRRNVTINADSSAVKDDGTVFWGQGEARLYLNKFDNVFQVKITKFSQGEYNPHNLSNMTVKMNFVLDNEQTISIDGTIQNAEAGEVSFTIKRDRAQRILKQTKDKNFYIVGKADASSLETVIYTGIYSDAKNMSDDLLNNPVFAYINAKLKECADCKAACEAERESLENEKVALAKAARELQASLKAIKDASKSLPAAKQTEINAKLPTSINQLENVDTETKLKTSSTNVVDEPASDGVKPASGATGSDSNESQTNSDNIKSC